VEKNLNEDGCDVSEEDELNEEIRVETKEEGAPFLSVIHVVSVSVCQSLDSFRVVLDGLSSDIIDGKLVLCK
jgi:hypothetical protein